MESLPWRAPAKSVYNSVQSGVKSNKENHISLRGEGCLQQMWPVLCPPTVPAQAHGAPLQAPATGLRSFWLTHRAGPTVRELVGPAASSDAWELEGDYVGFLTLRRDNHEMGSVLWPRGPQWDGDPLLHSGSCSLTYPILPPFFSHLTSSHPCWHFLGSPPR